MGLLLGASVLSVVEIFEFIIKAAIVQRKCRQVQVTKSHSPQVRKNTAIT